MDNFNPLTWPIQLWIPVIQQTLIVLGIVLLIILLIRAVTKFSLRNAFVMATITAVVGTMLGSIIAQGYNLTSWQQEAQARLESRGLNVLEVDPATSTVKLDIKSCVFTAKLLLDNRDTDFATEPDVWEYILTDSTESLQDDCE